ncbi:MAG: hypothetical protein ABJA67_00505 [Chthonomonadales bacterium]
MVNIVTCALQMILFTSPTPSCEPLTPVVQGRGGPTFQRPTEEEKEKNRIRIGISKEQQAKLEALFKETGDLMQEAFKKQGEKRKELSDVYKEYKYDKAKAASLQEELLQIRRQLAEISKKNEDKLRHILKKDQFDRFQTLLQEARDNHMKERGERGGRPGGRPGGGGPPPSHLN